MEDQRPRGYREFVNGERCWNRLGMRIVWVEPDVPDESAHELMKPLKAKLCVECLAHISPDNLTASVWTCLVHQDNTRGVYTELPMAFISKSPGNGSNTTHFLFETDIVPAQPGSFRLTYNVKLGQSLVWANVFRDDHMIQVFGGQTSHQSAAVLSSHIVSDLSDDPQFKLDMIRALAIQRCSMQAPGRREMSLNLNDLDSASKEVVEQISSLDHLVQNLSQDFDSRAIHLVNVGKRLDVSAASPVTATPTGRSMSVRSAWGWVFTAMQCAEVHLRHAARYHQFFLDVAETAEFMDFFLSHIHLSLKEKRTDGTRSEIEVMISEIKRVLAAYQQWQVKMTTLYEQAKDVVPVPQRKATLLEAIPVISLAEFNSDQIKFIEGETLMLLDNSDDKRWKVKTNDGQVGEVPAILLVIPPPYNPALESVLGMKLKFLSMWTNCVKRMGFQMIAAMVLVLRDWTEEDIQLFQNLPGSYKEKLLRVLRIVETELIKKWSGYGDFEELRERISRLIMILSMASSSQVNNTTSQRNDDFEIKTVHQILKFEEMLKSYQELWQHWEVYLNMLELLKHPDFMLYCDKWEQLKFLKSSKFVRFWENSADVVKEDITKSRESHVLAQTPKVKRNVDVRVEVEDKIQEATTDTVTSVTEEELQTYVIKTVIDPRDKMTPISLQKAIMLGIIDQIQRTYVNPQTGVAIPISEAINTGMIVIEILSWEKIKEETRSFGLITVKTTTEAHPYQVTGALDPVTRGRLTLTEAVDRKLFDADRSVYRTASGEEIQLEEAVKAGWLLTDDAMPTDGKLVTRSRESEETYAVWAVVDQRKKDRVSFTSALQTGLLDKETGEYIDNVTGHRVEVLEAISRGFLKARLVADPSRLDIDPRNSILVRKVKHAKQTLLTELKVIKAFKMFEK